MHREYKRKESDREPRNARPFVSIRTKIFAGCVAIALLSDSMRKDLAEMEEA